jgi:endoglucanase
LTDFSSANSNVYLGYTTWAAGGFDATYELTETPTQSGGKWTDTALVKSCVVGSWKNA